MPYAAYASDSDPSGALLLLIACAAKLMWRLKWAL
jgi:hypothetical protein